MYDTEGGRLHLSTDELVENVRAARLAAVREATGPACELTVDANRSLTGAEAIRRARTYEPLDIAWFEEPLPAEDVAGPCPARALDGGPRRRG